MIIGIYEVDDSILMKYPNLNQDRIERIFSFSVGLYFKKYSRVLPENQKIFLYKDNIGSTPVTLEMDLYPEIVYAFKYSNSIVSSSIKPFVTKQMIENIYNCITGIDLSGFPGINWDKLKSIINYNRKNSSIEITDGENRSREIIFLLNPDVFMHDLYNLGRYKI